MKPSKDFISKLMDTVVKRDTDPTARWVEQEVVILRKGKNTFQVTQKDVHGIGETEVREIELRVGDTLTLQNTYARWAMTEL